MSGESVTQTEASPLNNGPKIRVDLSPVWPGPGHVARISPEPRHLPRLTSHDWCQPEPNLMVTNDSDDDNCSN